MWEHLVSLVAVYPYRCHACNQRFLTFRYRALQDPTRPSSAEREVRATRAAIRWKHKKQEFVLYAIGAVAFLILMAT